jgi:hypothetical protein
MAMLDPASVAAKWAQRASAATADYQRGIETTDKDPTALAAAAGARYISAVQSAYNSGKWARRLQQVGKTGWQQASLTKGVANYGTGINQSEAKYATAIAPVLAAVQAGQRIVAGMPAVTDQQRDARMLAFVNHMRQFGANR